MVLMPPRLEELTAKLESLAIAKIYAAISEFAFLVELGAIFP